MSIIRTKSDDLLREAAFSQRHTPQEWGTIDYLQIEQSKFQRRRKQSTLQLLCDEVDNNNNNNKEGTSSSTSSPNIMTRHIYSGSQGSWPALLIGIILGLICIFCDASTHFVVNFRDGICVNYFWLGKSQCCAGLMAASEGTAAAAVSMGGDGDGENNDCKQLFMSWGQYLGANHHLQRLTDYILYTFWSCLFAVIAGFFCKVYSVYASGGGINEVKTIVSGHQRSKYLGGWTLATKAVSVCLSTGSGLVIGKEGPFVHIGASVGYIMSGCMYNNNNNNNNINSSNGDISINNKECSSSSSMVSAKRRDLITVGAAGGVAVAFGAPVGGVLFSLEEISGAYNFKVMMQSLIAGVVAVLVVKKVDMFHTGRIVQFSINYTHVWHWFELPVFAVMGILGGLVGALYNVANIRWCRIRRRHFKQWKILEILLLAFITATFNFIIPYCHGSMLELLSDTFQDCTPNNNNYNYNNNNRVELCKDSDQFKTMISLLLAGTFKLVLCIITVGAALPAGLLVPSLCVGALYGRAFGLMLDAAHTRYSNSFIFTECQRHVPCVIPGAYAIVGSAAVLTGVTRMTIALAVVMFELTGGLEYMVPVIIAILCAKATCDTINIDSIFELNIEENNFPYLDPKKEFFHEAYAFDILRERAFKVLHSTGYSFKDLNDLLERSECKGFPVTVSSSDMTYLGYITREDLKYAMIDTVTRHCNRVDADTKVTFCASSSMRGRVVRRGNDYCSNSTQLNSMNVNNNSNNRNYYTCVLGGNDNDVVNTSSAATTTTTTTGLSHGHISDRRCSKSSSMSSSVIMQSSCENIRNINDGDSDDSPLVIDYTSYIDTSLLHVEPTASVQYILSLFKALGNRIIIVSKYSRFKGIITKKDLITFMRQIEREEHM